MGGAVIDLAGHRVVVPGGSGGVGTGVVRAYLAAQATVVVPVRSAARADAVRELLGDHGDHLVVVEHDYGTFSEAEQLALMVEQRLGGIDSVVAPVGGWWSGPDLTGISADDWQSAFVSPATAHAALLRAFLSRMTDRGAYVIVVGESADYPVPHSGLVSIEQAALLMLQRVAAAEAGSTRRVFSFILGQVVTHLSDAGTITADDIGRVAAAASASPAAASQVVPLHDTAAAERTLTALVDARRP